MPSLVLGSARAQFTITLSAAASEPVSVDWFTTDGTALAGRDYEANSGTVVFAPGEVTKTVEVFVHGRTVETEDRVFYVRMLPPVNAILADEVGACVIRVDTTGSQPVMTVVIPKGEKGERGYSAYEIALQNGFVGTEAEWLESLKPDPAEVAEEVAPLLVADNMPVTAKGTENMMPKDTDTLGAFAGRIPYMPQGRKAIAPALLAGVNVVPISAFVGDAINPLAYTGFNVTVRRGAGLYNCDWEFLPDSNEIKITGAQAGDIPIAVNLAIGSGDAAKALFEYDGIRKTLAGWIGSIYAKLDSELGAALIGYINSGAGAALRSVESRLRDQVWARDFGAIGDGILRPVSDWYNPAFSAYRGYANLAAVQVDYPHVTSDTDSIDWAAIQAAANYAAAKGVRLNLGHGDFTINRTLEWPDGLYVDGEGAGEWLAWTPSFLKKKAPTQIRAVGTLPRVHKLVLVTDNRTSGGVVVNPSPRDANDGAYRLTSFMNDDGTARMFSCAVKTARTGRGVIQNNFRIVLNNDNLAGYNNTVSTALADDVDVGFWNESGQNLISNNVHAVGQWRMYGGLQTAVIDNDDETSGSGKTGSEYSRYIFCNFQGAVGFGIRGGDTYKVTEVGANYIGIENAPNLPFHQAATGRVKVGGSETSASNYTYTAVSVVGGNLRLTIAEAIGSVAVGNVLVANIYGFGISNTVLQDCEISGFCHPTGRRATQVGLSKPSAALEISGAFIRGANFRGTKFIGHEDVMWHLHNCADITFDGQSVVEAKTDSILGQVGSRIIASPTPSLNGRVPNPMGQTDGVIIEFGTSVTNPACDFRPYTNLAAPARFNGGGADIGLFTPQSVRWNRLQYPADRANTIIRAPKDGAVIIRDGAGTSRIQVTASETSLRDANGTSRISTNTDGSVSTISGGNASVRVSDGTIRATVDGAVTCGNSAARWLATYSREYFVGTGLVRIISGTADPEGSATAIPGCLYLVENGAPGQTLKKKNTGSGNVGWVAI